jgi:uncharacterized membrane protein
MDKLFGNIGLVIAAGFVGALALISATHGTFDVNLILRWLHVFFGITWIGLLYYFNFVQIPTMPSIPAELKPGVSKFIAPRALFFFRWAALLTVVTGLGIAFVMGYLHDAMTFAPGFALIGVGMWLALIMALNVWFVIWPNQKRALGIIQVTDAAKGKSAKAAMIASRFNVMLSIPMLYAMANFT